MMRSGHIRTIQKLPGHKSIRTKEVYAHLTDKHLHHVVSMLPSPNMVTVLVTPDDFFAPEITQVVDNKVVGNTGFEPVTSTVCKKQKRRENRAPFLYTLKIAPVMSHQKR